MYKAEISPNLRASLRMLKVPIERINPYCQYRQNAKTLDFAGFSAKFKNIFKIIFA